MDRPLNILAPVRYPWRFNSPRQSRHNISIRYFAPLNKISRKIEGMTIFNPFPLQHFDLVHGFNRIPLGRTPFIIGFESHMPRGYWRQKSMIFDFMSAELHSGRCRGIVAISEFARRYALHQHDNDRSRDALTAKMTVRYPNMPMPAEPDGFRANPGDPVRLVFVGNHFARKGGLASVRLAELAHQRGFSLELHIVSSLEMGAVSWIDPLRPEFFEKDLRLLHSLPNIVYHGSMPNHQVIPLIRNAHFVLLPTFEDTFGYSAIEAMVQSTPVVGTRQGALPEFIEDGVNGIMLHLDNGELGEWNHSGREDRETPAYEAVFRDETERLAHEGFDKIVQALADPSRYAAMREAARATAEKKFSAKDASQFWDDYYCQAVARS